MKIIRLIIITVFVGLFSSVTSFANQEVKTQMREVFKNYVKLFPYIYSEKKGSVDIKVLKKDLDNFKKSFINGKHNNKLMTSALAPSANMLMSSLEDIDESSSISNPKYFKSRLKNILASCTSCHSKLPANKYKKIEHKYGDVVNKYVLKNYDKAMVSYFLRDYDSALKFLKSDIHSLSANVKNSPLIEKRMKVIAKIYLMNLQDASGLHKYLTLYLTTTKNLSKSLTALLHSWQDNLKTWEIPNTIITEQKLKKLISKFLEPYKDDIFLGNISNKTISIYFMNGVISNYAIKNESTRMMPELLYWLGLIENHFTSINLYSLGDLYFKRCIKEFSSSPFAKRCFKSYKDSIYLGFTGSAGTNIPLSIKKELDNLLLLIKK
jgi:hypothetical protein